MSEHTAGTWEARPFDECQTVITADDPKGGKRRPMVCIVYRGGESRQQEFEANARLIAAAPDLLSLLQEYIESYTYPNYGPRHVASWFDDAYATIARATKETD